MIRIVLPGHLQNLAKVGREVVLSVDPPVTQRRVLDELERQFPMLKGTVRDHLTKKRRPFIRFFACEQDLSHEPIDAPLPEAVSRGDEPYLIVGAIAGGSVDLVVSEVAATGIKPVAPDPRITLSARDRVLINFARETIGLGASDMGCGLSAERFIDRLSTFQSDEEKAKLLRYFKTGAGEYGEDDQFMGVRMGQVFSLAKEFIDMDLTEVERLLNNPIHEVRAGALSIMDKKARRKRTSEDVREAMYLLYRNNINRINNWDLVDVSAPYVVGGYLFNRDRKPLYEMARSTNLWERRTAIVATAFFIRQGDIDDTFGIAELLINDNQDLIHKAVGGWLREAGKRDPQRLRAFLDRHAASMPRTMLRYAMEHLEKEEREYYRSLR